MKYFHTKKPDGLIRSDFENTTDVKLQSLINAENHVFNDFKHLQRNISMFNFLNVFKAQLSSEDKLYKAVDESGNKIDVNRIRDV